MPKKPRRFDAAEYLENSEDVAEYLSEAFATGDDQFIAQAIGTVARAAGMMQVAKKADVSRESLYRALSEDGNPEFSTVRKVLEALGVQLTVKASDAA